MISIDTLRVFSIMVWATVFVFRIPNIYRVVRGRALYYDVLWSLIGLFGLNVVGHNIRYFLLPVDTMVWAGLHIFSAGIGAAVLLVIAQYQRADNHGR